MPLKTLAYGVPSHTFLDYFQMSAYFGRKACKKFDKVIKMCYWDEFLHLPTLQDLQWIVKLYKEEHNLDGVFESLDCSHTYWKNCPKAWHGAYKGEEIKPSIVLETITDYHTFFWHASYGYAGTLNDHNELHLSPFCHSLINV